tara:strand:+ start:73 stop:261 length:189 start_codon:yes stop_codon:yes gene_type:complete
MVFWIKKLSKLVIFWPKNQIYLDFSQISFIAILLGNWIVAALISRGKSGLYKDTVPVNGWQG